MPRKKMGEILIENKVISEQDLHKALLRQKGTKKPIGQILEDMDVILEEDIAQALSSQFGFTYVKKFAQYKFPREILDKVEADFALSHMIFPLKMDKKLLYLAMSNPLDMALQNDLSFKLGLRVSPCVATSAEIKAAIKKHYLKEIKEHAGEQTVNILLVDNQEIVLNAAEAALKREGYLVYKANNGAEGLSIATQLLPDLVITEIAMPRMDGVQLYKSMRASHDLGRIPVIALAARTGAEDEARLLDMGFDDFIAKPINPIRLLARTRKALRLVTK